MKIPSYFAVLSLVLFCGSLSAANERNGPLNNQRHHIEGQDEPNELPREQNRAEAVPAVTDEEEVELDDLDQNEWDQELRRRRIQNLPFLMRRANSLLLYLLGL